MKALQILVLCCIAMLTASWQYTPKALSSGSCRDWPLGIHTQIKASILELEEQSSDVTERLDALAASIEALNTSIRQQVAELDSNVRVLQMTVDNFVNGTTSPPTTHQDTTAPSQETTTSAPETTTATQETTAPSQETTTATQETTTPETTTSAPDTTTPSQETMTLPEETTATSADTTSAPPETTPPTTASPTQETTTTDSVITPPPRGSFFNPASSCKEIPTSSAPGYYWLQNSATGNSAVSVYCDTIRSCCDISGGWTRVALLNMTDPADQCPEGFRLENRTEAPLRTCGRPGPPGCVSVTYNVPEPTYSHVCGRIIGYQFGGADAFITAHTLLTNYLTGVSLTHGTSFLNHIWSFAAAQDEATDVTTDICPCTRSDLTHVGTVHSQVGQDYFCDTGSSGAFQGSFYYAMDPLWDGQGCGGTSTCCDFNTPPWFCKQLPQQTADDIVMRLCHIAGSQFADILLETVELYVR